MLLHLYSLLRKGDQFQFHRLSFLFLVRFCAFLSKAHIVDIGVFLFILENRLFQGIFSIEKGIILCKFALPFSANSDKKATTQFIWWILWKLNSIVGDLNHGEIHNKLCRENWRNNYRSVAIFELNESNLVW